MTKREIIYIPPIAKRMIWRIMQLARERKCVEFRGKRVPAAIVQNWQARYLCNEILLGHIKEYKPKKNRL